MIVLNEIFVNNCIIIISVDSSMNMVGINFSLIYIYNKIWCGFNLLYFKNKSVGDLYFFLCAVPCHAMTFNKNTKRTDSTQREGLRQRNPTNR